jgi:hypothetical protein
VATPRTTFASCGRLTERLELGLVGFIGAVLILAAGGGVVYLGLWLVLRNAFAAWPDD